MPVITELNLLTENPEAEGEWIGYPDTVALAPDEPFLCRLCYLFEAEEPGGFTGIETEVCFTDENSLISHIVPVGVPEQTRYSVERHNGEYRVRFTPKEPYAERAEGTVEFVVASTGETCLADTVFSSTVGFSGVFRGESGDRQIGLEKPGPVWMVLERTPESEEQAPPCDMPCRAGEQGYCPKIVKMVPPGEFWRPETASSSQENASRYKTIGVAHRRSRKHFYW